MVKMFLSWPVVYYFCIYTSCYMGVIIIDPSFGECGVLWVCMGVNVGCYGSAWVGM